jgi:hypothetical protein
MLERNICAYDQWLNEWICLMRNPKIEIIGNDQVNIKGDVKRRDLVDRLTLIRVLEIADGEFF